MKTKTYTISEFSKMTGVSAKALRLYELRGLISPCQRGENNYRYYSESQAKEVEEVKTLTQMGFTLREVKSLIGFKGDNEDLLSLMKIQFQKIDENLNLLTQQKKELERVISKIRSTSNPRLNFDDADRKVALHGLSYKIKSFSDIELMEKIKKISNKDFLFTYSMVDKESQERLLSVLSPRAQKMVLEDASRMDELLSEHW